MCTLLKPGCSGVVCDPAFKLSEEETCQGACQSKIMK